MSANGGNFEWPLAIGVAPTGARRTKADHPALPITPREIAGEAARCLEAGAAMLHLHVRDDVGGHSLDPDRYRQAIEAVRAEVGDALVIQVTSEAAGRFAPQEQIDAVRALRPEAVSVAVRELFPSPDWEAHAGRFLSWCRSEGVQVQYILYSVEDLQAFHRLREEGRIPGARPWLLYVLGRYTGGQQSDPWDLLPFVTAPGGTGLPWMMCAFGRRETACAAAATALGGHVRVGFENNLHLPDGGVAPDNAALVAAAAGASRAIGRPLADGPTLRRWMSSWSR